MDFRLAVRQNLPQLKAVYKDIIQNMNDNQIQIWDDIYPCDFFDEEIRNNRAIQTRAKNGLNGKRKGAELYI